MTSIADVSNKLGEYMLKGWVLTDKSCKSPGCSVPLMRSPNGKTPAIHLCVKCDAPSEGSRLTVTTSADSTSSAASDSNISRSSTPPTEISSVLSSPVFAPPADTEESRRRREQSDTASAEIGKRLLKGWAMLGDECPNTRCYGVPLVRRPKAGGEKDPRKECVICGGVYNTEVDWAGRERLVPVVSDVSQPNNNSTTSPPSEADRAQNAPATAQPPLSVQPTISMPILHQTSNLTVTGSDRVQALEESASALQLTLRTLVARLKTISNLSIIDPSSIGATAEAISKVTQALSHVRQLQWSEIQAQGL